MKRVSTFIVVLQIIGLFATSLQAQGSLYVSSLGGSPTGNRPVGSDSWWGQGFFTGDNSAGYTFNSVELLMAAATGSPSGLIVSLYSFDFNTYRPDDYLATLEGSLGPTIAGIYAYTGSGVTLLPNSYYAIVLTAETATSVGAFRWRTTNLDGLQVSDGWAFSNLYYNSNDGINWNYGRLTFLQMGIYATAVPEPSAGVLFGLGLAGFGFWRRLNRPHH